MRLGRLQTQWGGEENRLGLGSAMIGAECDDDLFASGKVRQTITRSQKKANKCHHGGGSCQSDRFDKMNLARAEMKLQVEDPTLASEQVASEAVLQDRIFQAKWASLLTVDTTRMGTGRGRLHCQAVCLAPAVQETSVGGGPLNPNGHMGKTKTAPQEGSSSDSTGQLYTTMYYC